jgi:hypothetical protein
MTYFYQSNDGQRIYINGLNNRCLTAEYGSSLAQAPLTLTGRIVATESHFMTEENRRRFKYLAHLPLHTEFKVAELELGEPYVSRTTLATFQAEIDERRNARQRKISREKREADRALAAQLQAESSPHYYVASAMHKTTYIRSEQTEHIFTDLSEFPEASSSPPASSSASVGGQSSSSSGVSSMGSNSSGGGLVDPNISAAAAHVSFASKLKPQVSGEGSAWNRNNSASSAINASSVSAWPTLDTNSAPTPVTAKTQMTSGWLNMVKQQQEQEPVLGRTKKYQNPPKPWSTATNGLTSGAGAGGVRKPNLFGGSSSQESHDDEEKEPEAMPAPHYKQSFFSAIDESFRLIESSNYFEIIFQKIFKII